MSFDMWAECLRDKGGGVGGGCRRREGGPLWYWQNNAYGNFALFIVAGLQELNLTQTRLSPEGSWFSFYYLPSFPHFLTHSNDLLLLMKIWITKMLNGNKSKQMLQQFCQTQKKNWNMFWAEGWKKNLFAWLKLIKNVFLFLFCNAPMLSCMLNCGKTKRGWFTGSQMHQIESKCRCHRDFFFF